MNTICKNCGGKIDKEHDSFVHCEQCGWFIVEDGQWKAFQGEPPVKEQEPIQEPKPELTETKTEPEPETNPAQAVDEVDDQDEPGKSRLGLMAGVGVVLVLCAALFVPGKKLWQKYKAKNGVTDSPKAFPRLSKS